MGRWICFHSLSVPRALMSFPQPFMDARAPPSPLGPDSQPQKAPVLPQRTGVGGLHPCSKDFRSNVYKTGVSLGPVLKLWVVGAWSRAQPSSVFVPTCLPPAPGPQRHSQGDAEPCDEQLPPLWLPAGRDTPSSKLTSVLVLKTHAFFFVMKCGGQ